MAAPQKSKLRIRYTKAARKAKLKNSGDLLVSRALVKTKSRNVRPSMHVNKGDSVVVINGDSKGTIGKVLEVFRDEGKIVVEGVNIIKKHTKAAGPGQEGEIVEREAPIFASKVMLWDEQSKKASRVGHKILESGKKVRVFKTSQEQID